MHAASEDLATKDPQREAKVQVNFRLPSSMVPQLKATARLWAMEAAAAGEESEHIDSTYVVRRLLRVGITAAFDKYGGVPADLKSEETWQQLQAAIDKSGKTSKR